MKQAKESESKGGEEQLQECSRCGRKIPKSTRFCRECGTPQTADAFVLLVVGCIVTALAVFIAWRASAPYSLLINVAIPLITLIFFALILSFILWR